MNSTFVLLKILISNCEEISLTEEEIKSEGSFLFASAVDNRGFEKNSLDPL